MAFSAANLTKSPHFILSINTMLACSDMATIPTNNTIIPYMFLVVSLLAFRRIYPISKLKHAHKTLIVGEERPLPGGFANGVGNGSPETP